jgi:hypothetical protein
MNGVSRVLSEHSFFQHVFSTIGFESETPAGNVRILSLIARATAIWGNTGATRGQDSYDYGR